MKIQNSQWQNNTADSIKAVVFDMDGTLYTSEKILHKAYLEAVKDFNHQFKQDIPVPALDRILEQVGQPAYVIFKNLFPNLSSEEQQLLNSYSLKNLCNSIQDGGGEIFQGISQALDFLLYRQKRLYIASNGRYQYLAAILKGFDLERYFGELRTIESNGISTKAEIIKSYIADFGYEPEQVVMIGDRTSDINAAREAGTWFCGVTWGHGPVHEIEGADILLSQTSELKQLFS